MNDILKEIEEERRHQDKKWGGADHDDTHDSYAWISFIIYYLGQSTSDFVRDKGSFVFKLRNFRYNMIKVAALAVAAIESCDRFLEREEASKE